MMTTLKNVLLLNGISSAATGIILLVFAPEIARLFGVSENEVFFATGIFLFLFGCMVVYESRKSTTHSQHVLIIIALDILWVLSSMAIVLLGLFALSNLGYAIILAVAVWVGIMAYLQSKGLKQPAT
jgi:hypothetical protein